MQSNIAQIEVTNNKRFMLPINITELLEQNRIESNRIEYKQSWNLYDRQKKREAIIEQ